MRLGTKAHRYPSDVQTHRPTIRGETTPIGNEPCAALSGLLAMVTLNPGLAPWAFLCRPVGACFDARFGAHTGTPLRRPGFSRETPRTPRDPAKRPKFRH